MPKDGKNDFQNYLYLSEAQVSLKMRDLLNKHGVVFSHATNILSESDWINTKGIRQNMVTVNVNYKFYDVASGEFIEGSECGQGVDSGDKGIYKAITGAVKYIFMKNFLIPTGDDPEKSTSKSAIKASPHPQTIQSTTPTPNAPKTESSAASVAATAEKMFGIPPCDKCGGQFKERKGKFGKFYGCENFPKCNRILNLDQVAGYIRYHEDKSVPVPVPPDYQDEITKDDLPFG